MRMIIALLSWELNEINVKQLIQYPEIVAITVFIASNGDSVFPSEMNPAT